MPTHAREATAAVLQAAGRYSFRTRFPVSVFALLSVLSLSGCITGERVLVAGNDPADPTVPVPAVGYRSTTASHVSQRPVAPQPWRRQNERVTPQPKSEQ